MAGGEILDNKTQITVGGRVSPVNGQYYSGITVELIQIKDNEEYVCGSGVTDSNGYYTITARVFNINGMGKLFTHVGNDCSSIIDFDEHCMQFTVTGDFETEGSPVPFRCDGILAVDFDDGEWEVYNNSTIWQISHDYASTGNYHVQVYGNVTEILNTCFLECSSLTSITLPENLIGLAVSCFWKCNNLTSISIPRSVYLMGDSVFGWTGLTRVDFNWETASEIIPYNNTWFYNTPSSLKLYIPAGTTSLYVAKGYPSSKLIEDGTPFDDITVTSTNDILSYDDGDSTVLSAQLTNQGQAVSVSGESVTFEVRKVSDDSLVETLTDTTDSNGEASVEYFGKGSGDLYIEVSCRTLSKTYSNILDTQMYADDSKILNWSTSTGGGYVNYNSSYKLQNGESAYFKVSSLPNRYVIGFIQGNAYCQLQKDYNNIVLYISGQTAPTVTGSLSVDDVIKFEKVSDTEQKIYINDNLIATVNNHSMTAPNPMMREYSAYPFSMEYIYVL